MRSHVATVAPVCFASGGLYGWSGLIPALQSTYSVGAESAGLVFSLSIVAFSAAVFFAPRLPDCMRGPTGAGIAGLCGTAALICAALAPSYAAFLLAFCAGFGAASGAVYILTLEIAGRTHRPAVSTAVMVASFGLGGAVFGPGFRFLVAAGWGLDALLSLAFVLGVTSLLAVSIRAPAPTDDPSDEKGFRCKTQAVDREIVVALWAAFATGSMAGLMILGLATSIVESSGGPLWLSGFALAGIAIANTIGRLSAGALAGVIPLGAIAIAASSLSATGLAMARFTHSPEIVALSLVVVAGGYGLVASSFPILTRSLVGPARFGRTYAIVFTAWGVAGLLSPWAAGRLFDATSSFNAALVLAFAASVMSACLSWMILRRHNRAGGTA